MTVSFAERLLQSYGITEPDEIDLEAIAFDQGATVHYRRLKSCEARIVGHGSRAVISIDSNAYPRRKRFSLGHELGHWVQDKGTISMACDGRDIGAHRTFGVTRETQANAFASQLLLPSYIFDPLADKLPFTFAEVIRLADRFQASNTATAIKLVKCGRHVGMVACYVDGRYKWCIPAPDLPALQPVAMLDEDSTAYDLWKGLAASMRPTLQSGDTWFASEGADEFDVTEDSILIVPGTTLSLLWWKSDESLTRWRRD